MTVAALFAAVAAFYAFVFVLDYTRRRRRARRLAKVRQALEDSLAELRAAEARGVVADAELVLLRFGRRLVERDELTAPELVNLLNLVLADDDARRHR